MFFWPKTHMITTFSFKTILMHMQYGTPGQTKLRLPKCLFKRVFLRLKYDLNVYFYI
jgi:hypothetical protein